MSDLKPCPFCGGKADNDDGWVYCLDCGVGYESGSEVDMRGPEQLWNRRAPRFTAEERKAVEAALDMFEMCSFEEGLRHLDIIRAMLDGEKV